METIIEVLIDNSNSMGPFEVDKGNLTYLLEDGTTRMELAKKILVENIFPIINYSSKITVRLFHGETKNETSIPIIKTIFEGVYDLTEITKLINDIPIPIHTGGTPITAAIQTSIDSLAKFSNADRKIILVTDGQEDKGGDFKAAAEYGLKQYGIPCNIFIIGIGQNEEAEKISKQLSTATEGAYINLQAKSYDKIFVNNKLISLKKAVIEKSFQNRITNITPNNVQPHSKITPSDLVTFLPDTEEEYLQELENGNPHIVELHKMSVEREKNAYIKTNETRLETEQYNEVINKVNENTDSIKLLTQHLKILSDQLDAITKSSQEIDENAIPIISENKALNEKVRFASETLIYSRLKEKYLNRVKWLNENGESGLSYDFQILDLEDNKIEYYIECKGSIREEKIFYMTDNEWNLFLANPTNYQLYFVGNALSTPVINKIDNFKDALLKGRIVPFLNRNVVQKARRIIFQIVD